MKNNFGDFLSKKRKEANLTQKQLGEKLFLSESTISKWEKDKANPDISVITELAKILNVSEHEILTASVDSEERSRKQDAKKWRIMTRSVDSFFIIAYAIALLTCFICNLAVDKRLDWFFIVLTSIVLAGTFTTLPLFIKKKRLLILSLSPLLALLLLLLVCNIYVNGDWLYLASVPVVITFIIVFLPLYIATYQVPQLLKRHNAILSVAVDILLIGVLLAFLSYATNGDWFFDFALPLWAFVAVIPIIFVIIIRYTKLNKWIKSSVLTFLFVPFSIVGYLLTKVLCKNVFDVVVDDIIFPDFLLWNSDTLISSNVCAIILLTLTSISLIFLLLGIINKKYKR